MDYGDAMIAEEFNRLGKLGERAQELSGKLSELTVEEYAANGLVRVVVGEGARLRELVIEPRAMRLDSETLAREIVGAFDAAFDAYQEKMVGLLSDMVGEAGLSDVFAPPGEADIVKLTEDTLHGAVNEFGNVMAQIRANLR